MKALAEADRPREKLVRVGADALGDNELVAIVLGSGQRNRGALDLANSLLSAVGGLHRLTRSSRDALCRVPGVGEAQAARLLAAVELGRRTLLQPPALRPQLRSPRETASYLLPRFSARPVEHFGLVLLDVRSRVIRTALLSVGTIDATTVHPREVFREAAVAGASSLVLFHNHPSGDPSPSPDDVRLTARLVRAGEVMGIYFLTQFVSAWVPVIAAILGIIGLIFHELLKAPTRNGQKLMDQIDGVKMYLKTAEKDRLNFLNPPERTPQLFEKYLPYALALGVENEWAEQFSDVLAKAAQAPSDSTISAYHPMWYSGRSWGSWGRDTWGYGGPNDAA